MTPDATATATADVVGDLPSRFMLDMATYGAAAEDGFEARDAADLRLGRPHPDAEAAHTHTAWNEAEVATDRALAPAYEALDEVERVELRDLLEAARRSAS